MLSQLRLREDASHTYAAPVVVPALRLPSIRMSVPSYHSHDYHAARHHCHPYQRATTMLPPLTVPAPHPNVSQAAVTSPAPSSHKCSLAFILSAPAQDDVPSSSSDAGTSSDADSLDHDPLDRPHSLKHKRRANGSPTTTVGSKSKYCVVEGCTSRAKHARKCWRHGGSVKCKVQDCINRAKSRGVCWSHGGGTTCSHPNCGTIAVSHGFCWAHGGGKRCEIGGCSRPAYERTQNMCSTHFKQHKAAAKANAL